MDQAKLFLSSLEGVQKPDPGDPIHQSLRFRRGPWLEQPTPGLGNRRTFTVSFWTKLGTQQGGSSSYQLFQSGASTGDPVSGMQWMPSPNWGDYFRVDSYAGGNQVNLRTVAAFRDPSAWYHIVYSVDTTQAVEEDRLRIYVNGENQALTGTYPSQDYQMEFNDQGAGKVFTIGANTTSNGTYEGYMAEFYSIDGQALEPTVFGRYNAYEVWVPVKPEGLTFGSNGFYLDFSDPNDLGADQSPNGNNFTANNFDTFAGTVQTDLWRESFRDYNGAVSFSNYLGRTPWNPSSQLEISTGEMLLFEMEQAVTSIDVVWNGGLGGIQAGGTTWAVSPDGTAGSWTEVISNQPVSGVVPISNGGNEFRFIRAGAATQVGFGSGITQPSNIISTNYDWMVDTPTQNWAAWNSVSGTATSPVQFSDANLRVGSASTNPDTNFNPGYLTFGPFEVGKPGKYYFEMYDNSATGYRTCNFGVTNTYNSNPTAFWWSTGDTLSWYPETGIFYRNNAPTSVGPNSTAGNKGMAIDFENGTVTGYDYANGNTWDMTGLTSNLVFGEKYYIVAGTSQTSPGATSTPSTMPFNFGQQPFQYIVPEGFEGIQTQTLPKAPFFNGRDHFQVEVSDEIPPAVSTPVTDVSYIAQRNWSVDNNIYLSGTVGWNDSTNGYNENQITGAVINKALNESAYGGNKQTLSAPTVSNNTHITFTFNPPLSNIDATFSGGCDYSCGSLSGIAIPTWNGEQFQISHTQIVNKSAAELSSFGFGVIPWTAPYSASLSWLITMKNAQGTSDNIFIDDEYTLTFADAEDIEEFAVGGTVYKQGDESTIGTITAINGNVITLASNSTWQTGDVLVLERFQVLDYMETVFPDGLYWVKGVDYGNQHQLMDSVRGDNLALTLPNKGKQQNYTYNGGTNVAWCWKLDEERANGFDILSYQGDGQTSKVIPHNLDPTKPLDMVIVKGYNAPDTSDYINDANWMFWHKDMPANGYAYLQNPGPFSTNDGFWTANGLNNTLGSLTVGSDPDVNNGQDQRGGAIMYIAYLWQAVDTFSAFGSYSGNGDVDGPFIQTNFRPAFVLIKSSTTSDSWLMYDSTRQKQNPMNLVLEADNTAAEKNYTSGPNDIDFLSNGFKCRGTNGNMNGGGNYVWAAFAENPFQHPVTAR